MKLANFTDPQKLPNGSKVRHRGSFWIQKSWRNFSLKSIQKPKWVKKVAPGFQKHLLHLFLLVGQKIFKNRSSSKMSKNIIFRHLLFFCCILGKVGQVACICPILPPRNFYRPRSTP